MENKSRWKVFENADARTCIIIHLKLQKDQNYFLNGVAFMGRNILNMVVKIQSKINSPSMFFVDYIQLRAKRAENF